MAGTALWLGAVLAAPLLRAGGWVAGDILHLAFSGICHQLPERSYWLAGHSLAVCARCWGLYCGFALGVLLLPWLQRPAQWLLAHPRSVAIFVIPLCVDLLLSNTHLSRFLTGLVATLPIPILVWQAMQDLIRREWRFDLRRVL